MDFFTSPNTTLYNIIGRVGDFVYFPQAGAGTENHNEEALCPNLNTVVMLIVSEF